jgi:hypothetical protein
LADVLRAAGLTVVEEPGWHGRGVELASVSGIVGHHTACGPSGDCPSTSTLIHGRLDLAGPLCQLQLCRSGHYHCIADGKANHAGDGSWPGMKPNTNSDSIGIEAENMGDNIDVWPAVQMDAYARGVTAILAHLGLGAERFCTHYEWTRASGRKIDPRGPWQGGGDWYSGGTSTTRNADSFRAVVRLLLEGDDMTAEEHALLVKAADDAAYCRHILDDVLRVKVDAIYVDTHGTDHPELLAGMVKELVDGTKP